MGRVLVVLLLGVMVALSGSVLAVAEEHVLRVGIPGDIETIDPDFAQYPLANMLRLNVHEQWFKYQYIDTGQGYYRCNVTNIEGALFQSWELAEDRMSMIVHLREGVIFPRSGNELTADDLLYWRERALYNGVAGNWVLNKWTIVDMEKLDKYTVKFIFREPFQDVYYMISRGGASTVIDSKEAKEHATENDPYANEWIAQNGAGGCGEYCIESWERGVRMVLTANKNYWAGVPYFDKVVLEVIPSSATRAMLLQEGSLDIAIGLSTDELRSLERSPGVKVLKIPSRSRAVLIMNCRVFPFSIPQLRQAVAHMIPYETILNGVFGGDGFVPTGPIPVLGKDYDPTIRYPNYDEAKAKELLKAAGFPDGFSFSVIIRSGEPTARAIAILLKDTFRRVGIDMEIQVVPPAVFAEQEAKGTAQATLWGEGFLSYVDDAWYSIRGYVSGEPTNRSKYENPAVDWIYEKLRVTFEPELREELIKLWQDIIVHDIPQLPLAEHTLQYAMREDIKGFTLMEDSLLWFHSLYRE